MSILLESHKRHFDAAMNESSARENFAHDNRAWAEDAYARFRSEEERHRALLQALDDLRCTILYTDASR